MLGDRSRRNRAARCVEFRPSGRFGMTAAAKLLDRLERVKQAAPGRWLARCPAHEDRAPSLSIRELDDGRIRLNDFGGCGTDAVLAALWLTMSWASATTNAIASNVPPTPRLQTTPKKATS